MDPPIDFSKLKKKRPKNHEFIIDDGMINDRNEQIISNGTESRVIDGYYTYEYLLERVFSQIKKSRPESDEIPTGLKLKTPTVIKISTTRSAWINFFETCEALDRDKEHVQQFILSELGTEGSLAAENQLILKGKFIPKNIENLLTKYTKEYVCCKNCGSYKTKLVKDNSTRLFVMNCLKCRSTRTVATIKASIKK
jgi:translation initiation factor 2 subunit 2